MKKQSFQLILVLIYAIILAPACKQRVNSDLSEVDPSKWSSRIEKNNVELQDMMQKLKDTLYDLSSDLPYVAYDKRNHTFTEITRDDVFEKTDSVKGKEVFIGTRQSRYIYSLKPIDRFQENAERGKFKFMLVERDRMDGLVVSDMNLINYDFSNLSNNSQTQLKKMILQSTHGLKLTIKDEVFGGKERYKWIKSEYARKKAEYDLARKNRVDFLNENSITGEHKVGRARLGVGVYISTMIASVLIGGITLAITGFFLASTVESGLLRISVDVGLWFMLVAAIVVTVGVFYSFITYEKQPYYKDNSKAELSHLNAGGSFDRNKENELRELRLEMESLLIKMNTP